MLDGLLSGSFPFTLHSFEVLLPLNYRKPGKIEPTSKKKIESASMLIQFHIKNMI